MFRDVISKLSLRKKLTILAGVGVFLPVLVLTYMQYRSLTELQNKTKGAFKDNLRQGLTIVERQMKQRLEDVANRTLNPIGGIDLSSVDQLEKHFANVKSLHPKIEEVFAYVGGNAYVYADKFVKIPQAEFTATLSQFEQARLAQSFLDDNRKYLFVVPSNTRQGAYLFYPLQDGGFAGVLLNESFVRDDLIAGTIGKTLNMYHDENTTSSAIAITISDENRQVLYSNAAAQNGYFLETNFDPPFSNWKAGIGLKNTNLDDLARNSFLHSAGATVLVLVVLLFGIALTIRATDREARLAQAKSNFVANVSHELKTPLSLLSLFSEILELGRVKN